MNKKAFTIIEIAVAAVIVGILAMVAVPNVTAMMNRSYSQDAVNTLMSLNAIGQDYYQKNGVYFPQGIYAGGGTLNACQYRPLLGDDCLNNQVGANVKSNPRYNIYKCQMLGACTVENSNDPEYFLQLDLRKPVTQNYPVNCAVNVGWDLSVYNPCCGSFAGGILGGNKVPGERC
jgi:prepilin-type N-terminal cleavage/methylation domain-containing protein